LEEIMNDESVLENIGTLVKREHALYNKGELSEAEATELRGLELKLDQLWDLLRQRRAKEQYGQNPDEAKERAVSTVEGYTNAPYKGKPE
jgi:Protein of unknown function (DUF2630)